MKRIYPVLGIATISALNISCASKDKKAPEQKKYNIVYIMTDDHTA